jgi:hypothetical protein
MMRVILIMSLRPKKGITFVLFAYYFALTSKICITIYSKRSNHDPMSVTSVV